MAQEKNLFTVFLDIMEVLEIREGSVFLPPCFLGPADSGTVFVALRM